MSTSNIPLLIGGKSQDTIKHLEIKSALSGEVVTVAAAASVADANSAAEAASKAFPEWSAQAPNARRAALNRAADALDAKADEFVAAMMGEIGATEGWARFNLMLAVSIVREAASLTTQINGEVIPSDKPGQLSMGMREPVGVILGIAPWNAPIILGVRSIAVPLACGNTVIFKASEQCPGTHYLIASAFMEAGLGDGVVNFVSNSPEDAGEIVGALIDHPAVRRINFTGSSNVGRIIAERAAKNLKPVLLELGGKAPLLVLEDADLDAAVNAAAFGAFMNQGQICMSTERVIVVDAVADDFLARFKTKVDQLAVGDPAEGKTPLGAVVHQKSVDHVAELIADAVDKGANRLCGKDADGVLMPANVISELTPDMRLYSEESFGPVVGVIRAIDEEDAINIANDSEYGLSAAVFTRDIARGLQVARKIKSGICHINGPTVQDQAQIPFGGVKNSGYGRFGGKAGIDAFTELRWITVATQPEHYPF
ncbi:MAG: salicylaldehyde dehydrogenase [SAR86 cluster bacterium]|uniref:Salicylaldehyde dehydrogenase n=1 Tax=SAR86 cluster bacterium TaxID=2030880 RepID=A0A2A5CDM3_9GAMM|nr:MAG: salicylaldehyde dehydrogenase [SAR86 cluster bacterium]